MGMVAVTTRAIAVSGEELTFRQWRALVVACDRTGGVPLSELADRIGSGVSPASRLVRRMQARGWIDLAKADADRRVTLVRSTERGLALRDAIFDERRRSLARAAEAVGGSTPKEVALLMRIVDEVSRLA